LYDNSWALHYDNALAHASLVVQQFFALTNTTVFTHPPHSLDLAPCNFFLFLKMKLKLMGRCFDSVEEIQTKLQDMIETLMRNDFQWYCRSWKSPRIIVSMQKGTTSKGMEADRNFDKWLSCSRRILGTLG